MYDLIILGAGPAGITAAIYAIRKKMSFLIISENVGGQTLWTNNIENYTHSNKWSKQCIPKKKEWIYIK